MEKRPVTIDRTDEVGARQIIVAYARTEVCRFPGTSFYTVGRKKGRDERRSKHRRRITRPIFARRAFPPVSRC